MTRLPSDERSPLASSVGTLLFIAFGALVWAAQFSVAYAVSTLACVVWQSPRWSYAVVASATIVALGMMALYVVRTQAFASLFGLPAVIAQREGLIETGRAVALLATFAIVWTGVTLGFVDACAQGR